MKRVLVTGSSRGIGKAIAARLAADGFTVVTHALKSPDADLHFDIADREATRRILEADIAAHGPYHGVVLNAGLNADAPFPVLDGNMWDRVIDTDLTGFYNVLQPIVMPMISNRIRGRISGRIGTGRDRRSAFRRCAAASCRRGCLRPCRCS